MPGIYLEIIDDRGKKSDVVKLSGKRFVLGRSQNCDVSIPSDLASRQHAEVTLAGDVWSVKDLDSSNGTLLNGQPVGSRDLAMLDVIQFGKGGWKARVVNMDPAPPRSAGSEAATRVIGRPSAPRHEPAPPRGQPRAPAPPAPAKSGGGKMWIFRLGIFLACLGFAFLTWKEIWTDTFKIRDFPYPEVAAPILWAVRGILEVSRSFYFEHSGWIDPALFGIWFGLIGIALARPIRRIILLLVLAGIHVAAVLLLPTLEKL